MSVDKSCEYCGRNNISFKNELTLAKDKLLLTMLSLQDNKLIKIP